MTHNSWAVQLHRYGARTSWFAKRSRPRTPELTRCGSGVVWGLGAVPVAVSGPCNVQVCRDLGAEEVYSYAQTRPAYIAWRFTAVLDAAGVDTPPRRAGCLRR